MYNVYNKSDVFYLYTFSKNQTHLIGNKEDLIKFISRAFSTSYWDRTLANKYFDNINMGNDIYYVKKETKVLNEDETYQYIYEYIVNSKEYMFFDGYNRIVDVRNFKEECIKYFNLHKNDRYYHKYCRKMYPKSHAQTRYKHTFAHNKMKIRKMDSMFKCDEEYRDLERQKARKTRKSFIKEKRNLKKVQDRTWWAVNQADEGHLRRDYVSNRKKYVKRKCNKELRKIYNVGNGANYRKASEFWWEVF